jgi:DNA-binding response OmpR family regulator
VKKPYVAIVDDDSAFANYLRTFLSLRGYETRSYSRGDELVAAVKAGDPPDIVLLDVMMPGMNGFEVLAALRERNLAARTRIVLMTCRTSGRDHLRGWELGADEYVTKPFEPGLLAARLRELLAAPPDALAERRSSELQKAALLDRLEATMRPPRRRSITSRS